MNRKLHQDPAAAGASLFFSEVDDLIMFAPLDAMFLRTDLVSRPANSAFSRAGNCGNANLRKMSAEMDKSFTMRTYEKRACKSLTICTYKITGLKLPWNEHLQKTPGGRGPPPAIRLFQLSTGSSRVNNVRRTTAGAGHISEPVVDGTWDGCYKFSSFVQCPAKSAEAWGAFWCAG
jgi:hypothetical protein